MSDKPTFDVLGVGNAIVDVLASVEDTFLSEHTIAKGAMTLIDDDRAAQLYDAMPPGKEISGGSAANTVAGVASFGGKAAYLGKVAEDQLGAVFAHDLRAAGVAYDVAPLSGGPATARCLILVTPDGQRSMNTYLGASSLFDVADVSAAAVQDAAITYLEGYLFDRDEAKRAFVKAAETAQASGRRVALTLSDGFCVDRHRDSFRQLLKNHVDYLFANETEILSLYQTHDFDDALQRARSECRVAFLTRSEKGSVAVDHDEVHIIDAAPTPGVVDTTGAGDLYAAGVLFGLARGLRIDQCARLGSLAASEVISHFGGRPEKSLADLAADAGLMAEG